jgi:predicted naringenin-chalcone synthase
MTWSIGDHGVQVTLSKKVPGLIDENLKPWMVSWLGENGLTLDQIASWAIHPGGPRIIDSVEQALGIDRRATETARSVFADHGNMSSPTVLFILDRLHRENAPRPCVAIGFGPGLTAEAAILK